MATPEEMQASMIANLLERTGRPLEAWIVEVRSSGLEKHGQIVAMLKAQGVSHGYANLIAHMTREGKKAYVSLRRSKQFGLLQPSTKTRLDVGIKLKDATPTARLEASGSWNVMVTHRVRVAAKDEVDDELIGWLRRAYDDA